MKKFYFLAAAMLLGAGAYAQMLDLTPDRFKFANQNEGQFLINWYNAGVNPAASLPQATEGADAGFLALCTNPAGVETGTEATTELAAAFQANTNIYDLGGTAGKVLLLKGYENTSEYGPEATPCSTTGWWGNFAFYSKVSGATLDAKMRVRLVYNVISDTEWSYDPVAAITISTATNNVVKMMDEAGTQVNGINGAYFQPDIFYTNEDEGTNDLTKWRVMEIDFNVPEEAGFPVRTRFELKADFWKKSVIMIKELTYTLNPEGEAENDFVNYTVDGSTSVADIIGGEENLFTVNGNQVSFAAAGNVCSINGVQVADAVAGETITLDRGIYVVKAGNKAEKLIVK